LTLRGETAYVLRVSGSIHINKNKTLMKSIFLCLLTSLALVQLSLADDVTVHISDVHLCCASCVKGVTNAVKDIDGIKASADKETKVVELTGPDKATLQKAANALTKAGYFGVCSDDSIKIDASTGAKGEKVQTLKVEGVHLCCPKCVKAVTAALKDVDGVTTNNATKNAEFFIVTGDFKDSDVFTALQKAGLTGKVGQ
jgi:copper chaperone CopZ